MTSGHWVLVQFAAWSIGRLFLMLSGILELESRGSPLSEQMQKGLILCSLIPQLASGSVAVIAICLARPPLRWRWYFGAILVLSVFQLLWGALLFMPAEAAEELGIGGPIFMLIRVLCLAVLSVVTTLSILLSWSGDLADRFVSYDRQHRLGIGMYAFYCCLVLLDTVVIFL